MKNTKILIVCLALLSTAVLYAEDSFVDCLSAESLIMNSEKDVLPISGLTIDSKSEFVFCYDINADPNRKELNEEFKLLDTMGVFDQQGCVIDQKRIESVDLLLKKFIAKNVSENVSIYAVVHPVSKRANLVYSNTDNTNFVNGALSTKDKWQIAGFSAGSIAIGALISEKIYAGQADKRKHWMVGATISGVTTGATYFLLESAGLGDKLGLSKNQKKFLIMLSGPIVGTLAGIVKEGLDSRNKKKHTVDINDAAATSLGAGGAMFAITFAL
ncbi:MAG: hypothetical protein HOP07_06345 [Bacteriovoracaceae bacterium]|nr:hypothetical protein [Bacteriovoracaceae bacterium]